jgi:hypothetical protein
MSRPTQAKLEAALRDIEMMLERDDSPVTMPYRMAIDLSVDMRAAQKHAEALSTFVTLSNKAFEAMEGLLANWPDTSVVGKYEPGSTAVLMKDQAIEQAAAALKAYRDVAGDFTW